MAACTGLIVANIYYCQPLVVLIAREFNITEARAGAVNYLTQAGYAAGLFLLVPLGDMFEKRKQILLTTGASVIALLMAALAPGFLFLEIACFLIGATSIVPQLVLPLTAALSDDNNRGHNIGIVMSGLLVGILASRTISGALGFWLNWRAVFYIAAGICVLLIIIMAMRFPKSLPQFKGGYVALMRSMLGYIKTQPVLREATIISFNAFAVIMGFWTVMVLHLSGPAYNYTTLQIGLFGIIGAGGALAAPIVGKMSDSGNPGRTLMIGFVLEMISLLLFYIWGNNLYLFIAGVILIDIAHQAIHVTNQTRIYALVPEARNRLNTIYMSVSFIGASTGSALGLLLWSLGGWNLFCLGCLGLLVVNIIIFLFYRKKFV